VILYGDIMLEFGGVGKGYLIDLIRGIIDDYCIRHSDEGRIQISERLGYGSFMPQDDEVRGNIRYLIDFG
jgi:hypothetical protein